MLFDAQLKKTTLNTHANKETRISQRICAIWSGPSLHPCRIYMTTVKPIMRLHVSLAVCLVLIAGGFFFFFFFFFLDKGLFLPWYGIVLTGNDFFTNDVIESTESCTYYGE